MKTLFRLITFLTIVLAAHSCARIDAEIDALKERMSALERRVGELNSEIDELGALVRQIHIGNYVTAVIKDKDSNGYLLAFSDGSSVHLDIPDELREEAPQIGVRQDDDGVWYWTLGGDLMVAEIEFVLPLRPSKSRSSRWKGMSGLFPTTAALPGK